MKKLSMVDKGFLPSETREMPMHVGGVSLYTLPEGVDEQEFLHSLAHNVRNADALLPPFGDRLKLGRMGLAGNAFWEPDPAMDMDYHVRHSALPKPGRYRELFNLVSRLHGTLLERSRPLWEMHLIEGLQNRQFAVYTKTHHAAGGRRPFHAHLTQYALCRPESCAGRITPVPAVLAALQGRPAHGQTRRAQ